MPMVKESVQRLTSIREKRRKRETPNLDRLPCLGCLHRRALSFELEAVQLLQDRDVSVHALVANVLERCFSGPKETTSSAGSFSDNPGSLAQGLVDQGLWVQR